MPSVMENVVAGMLAALRTLNDTTLAGVTVDGAKAVSGKGYKDSVIVGHDGDPESDAEPVFTQDWANMAHTRRTETGDIPGAVVATTGSTSTDTVRQRAFDVLAVVEASLLADPTLAGLVGSLEFMGGAARTIENSLGSAVVIPFSVHYWAPNI